MSSISLSMVSTNNVSRGTCTTIHGPGGLGKSTLGVEACLDANGLMVLSEDGISMMGADVARTPVIKSWMDFKTIIKELVTEKHDFKTVVIDTMDGFTTTLNDYVVDTIYGGDNQKASAYMVKYGDMISEFNGLLEGFELLMAQGINIICLAHSIVDTYRAPDSENFQHWSLAMPGGAKTSTANALFDFSDTVLFAKRDVVVADNKGAGGQHVLMSKWDPAYDAKSRSKDIPDKFPLSWETLKKYI